MRRRIAFVTNRCPYYRRPLFELLAQRLDVDFYFDSEGSESELGDFRTIDIRRFGFGSQVIQPALFSRLRRERYDAVVKCLSGRLMLPFVYSIAHVRRLPFVLWTGMWHHPRTLSRRLTQPLVNGIYRGADAIVIYGEHVRRYLAEVNAVDPHKLFVAGVAIESSRFASAQPTFDEPPVVLYVGRLEKVKGLDILLAAAKRVEASFGLRLIGGGSLANEFREAGVEVVGPLTQDELPEELERARCLVLPSVTTAGDRETWGLVVNEAMTAGLPVIATEAVGAAAAGLVVDGRNGFIVPERDPSALADAIRRLVSDAQQARRFGEQARADVARFSYEAMADAFEAAIEYAVERRG